MKDLNIPTALNNMPMPGFAGIPEDTRKLVKVLYPNDSRQKQRAIDIMLMDCDGAILPRMPDRLPALSQLRTMNPTERSFKLMMQIANLALQIEMLKRGNNLPADCSRPVKTQLRNARRRLRRACLHAEQSRLWRDGRWRIGGLMQLLDNHQTGTHTR